MSEEKIDAYTVYASTDYVDEKIANVNSVKDWNINDENDPAYIKNRTHWTEIVVNQALFDMTDVPFTYDEGNGISYSADAYNISSLFIEGMSYIVIWDGVRYDNLVPVINEEENWYYIGAPWDNVSEKLPFNITAWEEDGTSAINISAYGNTTSHSIKIFTENEIVHKIDDKYMPNGYPYIEGTEKVLIPDLEGSLSYGMYFFNSNDEGVIIEDFEAGQKYVLTVGGVDYVAVGKISNDGVTYIGNDYIYDNNLSDSGEPFMVTRTGDEYVVIIAEDILVKTIRLVKDDVIIHKIDNKYLPDSLQFGTETVELFTLDLSTELPVDDQYDYIESQGYTHKQTNMAMWELTKNIGPVNLQSLIGTKLEMNRSDYTNADLTITADDIVDDVLTKYKVRLTSAGDLTIELEGGGATYTVSGYVKTLRAPKVTPINPEFLYTPDWNENDETSPTYIKNRTHWNERSWTILEETTFTIDYLYNDVHQYVLPTPEDDTLTIGATYIVNWNGDEYTVTAYKYKYNDNLICLGNESLSSTENDTGEPFLIELNINRFDGRETEFRLHTKDTEGTISIFKPEIIHKLDSKYLPESIVTKDYVDQKIAEINIETPTEYESIILKSSVSGSTKKFRLTIDDDGVLSAEEVVL